MPVIRVETLIAAPIERCFDLMRDVDVHTQSTAGTQERAVAGVTTGLLKAGDEVTWKAVLQPTPRHLPLERYVPPGEFAELRAEALAIGFPHVEAGPLVRSSYHAREQVDALPGAPGSQGAVTGEQTSVVDSPPTRC